ncbi:hypothetical protein ABVK25_006821 [Lepraria finkii]|uniref:Uncharacterized protein n=1 Tax=Lepraria finkii TaxID=1340010 RepID=A0ABR4B762_9LECA
MSRRMGIIDDRVKNMIIAILLSLLPHFPTTLSHSQYGHHDTGAAFPPKPPRLPWSSFLTQIYPPKPAFTEKNVPDLSGKIYIVTGSNTGVGKAAAQVLYSNNAKIYMAARSEDKAKRAIADIQKAWPQSKGSLPRTSPTCP